MLEMIHRFSILFLLLAFGTATASAQGTACNTAITLNLNGAPAVGTFSAACGNIPITNTVSENIDAGAPCNPGVCSQEMWFYLFPNDPANQQNLQFQLTPNFNGNFKWVLLYSEAWEGSHNLPPHCGWVNGRSTNFTQRGSMCVNATSGNTYTFSPTGLDGSGTFLLLVQRETGTGGTVTVQVSNQSGNPTCSAPANDRCSAAATMDTPTNGGSGIDDLYATGGSNTWDDAIFGTTQCATKERIVSVGGLPSSTSECSSASGSPNPTEDMYAQIDPFLPTFCFTDKSIGDGGNVVMGLTSCVENLDNTIFYSFTAPMTAGDWYLHLGNISCVWGPDTLQVLIADNVDCADAQNTTLLASGGCGRAGASGLFPDPDGSFGPLSLIQGLPYWIIIDGKQSAQCDFQMVLTRTATINPILPLTFGEASGRALPDFNLLTWALESTDHLSHFEIERSLDGQLFETLGALVATEPHQYRDFQSPVGVSYYRIAAFDLNGQVSYSDQIRLEREALGLVLQQLALAPDGLQLTLSLATGQSLKVELLNLAGQTVQQVQQSFPAGTHPIQIPLPDLSRGLYLVRLSTEDQVLVRKLLY